MLSEEERIGSNDTYLRIDSLRGTQPTLMKKTR